MAEEINVDPLLKEMNTLMKSVKDFSTDLNKRKSIESEKRKKLESSNVYFSEIRSAILTSDLLAESMLYPRKYIEIVTGFVVKMQELIDKINEIDKELQEKEKILEMKLKKVEKFQKEILKKIAKADEWKVILHHAKKKTESGVLALPSTREAADLLKGWYEFEKATTNFIIDMAVNIEMMNWLQIGLQVDGLQVDDLQVDGEFLEFENKIKRLEESFKQIVDNIHDIHELGGKTLKNDLGSQSQNIESPDWRVQDATSFADLEREESPQKMREEFEFEPQRLNNKLAKEKQKGKENEEKLRSLESKNKKPLAEIAKNKEEIDKRDDLLREKDQEIEELRRELERYRELKNAQEETEAKLVKLEEMQEFNVTIIQEKDMRIEELQGFTREIDGTLNKIAELNNNQDGGLQMKIKDGLEEGKEYIKEASSLEERITEKSKFSLREVSEYHSLNGKRSFGSLLASYEEDSGIKSASKNLKNGKENAKEVFSQKDDQVVKKIKPE